MATMTMTRITTAKTLRQPARARLTFRFPVGAGATVVVVAPTCGGAGGAGAELGGYHFPSLAIHHPGPCEVSLIALPLPSVEGRYPDSGGDAEALRAVPKISAARWSCTTRPWLSMSAVVDFLACSM